VRLLCGYTWVYAELAKRFAAYGLHHDALIVSYGLAEHVAAVTWAPRRR
jgi:hypothetical protein